MTRSKSKEFRDPVHGYISVRADWCAAFIDTAIFQRLRDIEQTSMRPLYPSARHDRFTHSLGVYHLAKIAFECLSENTSDSILQGADLSLYRPAFLVASLMHDCAHACFSHTFEKRYDRQNRARDLLFSLVDEDFKRDYEVRCNEDLDLAPAPHETFSAAIFLKHYQDRYQELYPNSDPLLVARMITGCVHSLAGSQPCQIENCLIKLLNGEAIDVDKLDYIVRDTWSCGVDNVSVDVRRLLSALEIVEESNKLEVAFRKSALSVIQSVIDGRNYLYRWNYSHHTVCYYTRVLRDAVERLDEVIPGFMDVVFSSEVFESPVPLGSYSIYLPSDSDIYAMLKAHRNEMSEMVDELLSRRATRVPIWKTQAEFEILFEKKSTRERTTIRNKVATILEPAIGASADDILVELVQPKVVRSDVKEAKVLVKLLGRVVPFGQIAEKWQEAKGEKRNTSFFYVYIPREHEAKIPECIQLLTTAPVYV